MPKTTKEMSKEPGSIIDRIPAGARILLIRLRSMGDCVLTTPAVGILARSRPDVKIGVVVEPRFAAIFEDNPAIAAILQPSWIQVARWHPALCLNFHGGRRSMALTLASRAAIRAGFGHHRGSGLYHIRIPRAQEILGVERPVHTAEHLASAMFYLDGVSLVLTHRQEFAAVIEQQGGGVSALNRMLREKLGISAAATQ